MKTEIENQTKEQLLKYLSENYGQRGINETGLTKNVNNRDIETIRKEVLIQMQITI